MARYYNSYKKNDEVEFVRTAYGKDMVKVLRIQRDGKYHSIKEVATSVELTLSSKKDYLYGDNSDIIPTDTMKNTVYALAKLKGVCFLLLFCFVF
ncbi:PREDICTED: uricase-like [Hipposideros armiger]|uniref:Uricase n=1 Tax=Hipposideros armiger TaxID=186990 RepID=A0A8B7RQF3_HIPAR|nr:PREDICTED: uricase-like [Hipposideros armiger]